MEHHDLLRGLNKPELRRLLVVMQVHHREDPRRYTLTRTELIGLILELKPAAIIQAYSLIPSVSTHTFDLEKYKPFYTPAERERIQAIAARNRLP